MGEAELLAELERKTAEVEDLRHQLAEERKLAEELQRRLDGGCDRPDDEMDTYDVVVKTSSLLDFISSGRIQVQISARSVLEVAKQNRFQIVAVAGIFGKGKTFVINEMWGKRLPSGKLYTTEGLSMLWIECHNLLIVDSA